MVLKNKMYIIGTKDRPTKILTSEFDYTEDIGEALFYMDKAIATIDMNDCDDPSLYCIYEADVTVSNI